MKLRIFNNSIRLRLAQGEVARLADEGSVEARLELNPHSAFTYRVVAETGSRAARVTFADSRLEIAVPAAALRNWALGNDVSLTAEQDNGAGTLGILIEKDFHCIHREGSLEDVDTFPNPSL